MKFSYSELLHCLQVCTNQLHQIRQHGEVSHKISKKAGSALSICPNRKNILNQAVFFDEIERRGGMKISQFVFGKELQPGSRERYYVDRCRQRDGGILWRVTTGGKWELNSEEGEVGVFRHRSSSESIDPFRYSTLRKAVSKYITFFDGVKWEGAMPVYPKNQDQDG